MTTKERDINIVEDVFNHRVLSTQHITDLHFNGSKNEAGAKRRLRQLTEHGYLARKQIPVMPGWGNSPMLYILDKRGVQLLRSERGYENIKWFASSKDLKPLFLEHTRALSDFTVALILAIRNMPGWELVEWRTERQIKSDYDPKLDRVKVKAPKAKVSQTIPLLPDAFYVVKTDNGNARLLLELDRATMNASKYSLKMSAYIAGLEGGQLKKRYGGIPARILTVVSTTGRTGGARRRDNLKRNTERITKSERFAFATLADITPDTIFKAKIWSKAGESAPSTLF